jgi:hypothetical protein
MTDSDEAVGELYEGEGHLIQHRIYTRSQKKGDRDRQTSDQVNQNMIASQDGLDPILRPVSISPQEPPSVGANEEVEEATGLNFDEVSFDGIRMNAYNEDTALFNVDANEADRRRRIIRENKTLSSQSAPVRDAVNRSQEERSCGPENRLTSVNPLKLVAEKSNYRKSITCNMPSFQVGSGEEDDFTLQ